MNRYLLLFILPLFISACNKEKKSLRHLNGKWEITSYQEIIFDGTTKFYDIVTEEAEFSSSSKSKTGKSTLAWKATNTMDTATFSFMGDFTQVNVELFALQSTSDTLECKITRQLKKDMSLELVVNQDRKSILHLRKE